MSSCVLLLSGGMDSATAGAIAKSLGFDIHALTVSYGQRHAVELQSAAKAAKFLGVASHRTVSIDLGAIGGSALTSDAIAVPKNRSDAEIGDDIPVTYVPARNTIMLSVALGLAEVTKSSDIFIGVNAVDYSGYPDCRPEFIQAFEALAHVATKSAVEGHRLTIHAPLIALSKADIIRRGLELGVDYGLTTTCYDPGSDGLACGRCDACRIRLHAYAELGLTDPVRYQP